jgi:hypothetical protein
LTFDDSDKRWLAYLRAHVGNLKLLPAIVTHWEQTLNRLPGRRSNIAAFGVDHMRRQEEFLCRGEVCHPPPVPRPAARFKFLHQNPQLAPNLLM